MSEMDTKYFAAIRAYTDDYAFGPKKPELRKGVTADAFRQYYYDKNELTAFCNEVGIPTSGLKEDLSQRIELYLRKGIITRSGPAPKRAGTPDSELGLSKERVVDNYKSDHATRQFFETHVDNFTGFKAKILKWIKEQQTANVTFTYGDIIAMYQELLSNNKSSGVHKVAYESCEMNQFYSDYSNDQAKKPHKVAEAWVLVRDASGPKTYAQYKLKIVAIVKHFTRQQTGN